MKVELCTYRPPYAEPCGKAREDETVHSWPNERRRLGTHVFRHDPRAAVPTPKKPPRSLDYQRGWDAGYHAGRKYAARLTRGEQARD